MEVASVHIEFVVMRVRDYPSRKPEIQSGGSGTVVELVELAEANQPGGEANS